MTDIDRLRLAIDKWGQALIMEIQWLREAIVAQNISICESCANNPCNKKAMLGDRRIYECTMYERAEQTEPQTCETCRHYNPNHEAIACERCLDGKYSRYEPQTDCAWQNDEHIPTDLASTMLKNRFKEQK